MVSLGSASCNKKAFRNQIIMLAGGKDLKLQK